MDHATPAPGPDYEVLPDNSASMIHIAMIDNLAHRATGENTPTWRDT